jgi:hypothetical protein
MSSISARDSRATSRQKIYLVQTHFRKTETARNNSHQNVLVIRTQVKILMYKPILKPIWTDGIQLWGTASTSNIAILERIIVDAPRYVPNTVIRRALN